MWYKLGDIVPEAHSFEKEKTTMNMNDDNQPTHYVLLGVPTCATREEITEKYTELISQCKALADAGDKNEMRRYFWLEEAYLCLTDPFTRLTYDEQLGIAAAQAAQAQEEHRVSLLPPINTAEEYALEIKAANARYADELKRADERYGTSCKMADEKYTHLVREAGEQYASSIKIAQSAYRSGAALAKEDCRTKLNAAKGDSSAIDSAIQIRNDILDNLLHIKNSLENDAFRTQNAQKDLAFQEHQAAKSNAYRELASIKEAAHRRLRQEMSELDMRYIR